MSTLFRQEAVEAWTNIARGLSRSDDPADRELAQSVEQFVRSMPFVRARGLTLDNAQLRREITSGREPSRDVPLAPGSPEMGR